nr:uncharacterized protein LOC109173928 [Ipomoea trifida]
MNLYLSPRLVAAAMGRAPARFLSSPRPFGECWFRLQIWFLALEKVALQRNELTQKGEEVDENQLYYDAVGGHDKKRRIYRLGSYGTFIRGPINANTSDNITSTSQPSDNANSAKMQDEIQNLKASLVLMQQRLDAIESERAGTSSSPSSYPNST